MKAHRQIRKKILVALLWIVVWQAAAFVIHNPIMLAGPLETAITLAHLVCTADFWISTGSTLARITCGFLCGSAAGILLAVLCVKNKIARDVFEPVIGLIRTVPVVSIVILLLIWAGNGMLSLWISMMVVLPILYFNVIRGLQSVDEKLLEMADLFQMRFRNRVTGIWLPHLKPFLASAFSIACGLAWKSGVAAEVIGQPLRSIGNGLYRGKINLDTGRVFAWTIVTIFLAWVLEKIVQAVLNRWVRDEK